MHIKQLVEQAEKIWKLEELCKDLSEAKKISTNRERLQTLSQQEIDCLCALICGYQPKKIAEILNLDAEGLRVNLNKYLYRYIETMIITKKNQSVQIKWDNIPRLLEELEYKRIQPSEEQRVVWRLVFDLPHLDSLQLESILNLLRQILGNASLRIERIEKGSVVLVFDGLQNGFERVQVLFRNGQLTELLGLPVLDVRLESVAAPVNLGEWFTNNFAEAIQLGWQTIEEIFGITTARPAFRSNAVKRAKQIQLGDRTLALILDLTKTENQEISLFLGIYPLENQTYLPENLTVIVLFQGEEPLEIPVPNNSQGTIQELFFSSGENFSIQISLGDDSVIEYFFFE